METIFRSLDTRRKIANGFYAAVGNVAGGKNQIGLAALFDVTGDGMDEIVQAFR